MGEPADSMSFPIPRIPASAGAMIFDAERRLLILKPNYKKGWTVPGGQIEEGESPWDACRREVREECGLEVVKGRLACVDFLRPRKHRPGGARFLFDCGAFAATEFGEIELEDSELDEYRFVTLTEAASLLSGPVGRRVAAGAGADRCVYLEEGLPVAGVLDR